MVPLSPKANEHIQPLTLTHLPPSLKKGEKVSMLHYCIGCQDAFFLTMLCFQFSLTLISHFTSMGIHLNKLLVLIGCNMIWS
jgi:hypothetical protein